jgi:hypothetical protein
VQSRPPRPLAPTFSRSFTGRYSGSSGGVTASTLNHVPVTIVEARLAAGASVQHDLPGSHNGFVHILEGEGTFGADAAAGHPGQTLWVDRLEADTAGTRTGFDDNSPAPANPLEAYTRQRQTAAEVLADAVNHGDDPAAVAKVIVAAATDRKPKLRYTIPGRSRQLSTMRRFVPARAFDKQLRKYFKLTV